MNQAYLALLLSLLAGAATAVGGLTVFFRKNIKPTPLSFTLGFSAGIMIYISIACMMVESSDFFKVQYNDTISGLCTIVFTAAGMLLCVLIDTFVPKTHSIYAANGEVKMQDNKSVRLYRASMLTAVTIALHNFPEGIATFMAGYGDVSEGISMALAVALHNIPEGIAVSVPLCYATGSRSRGFIYSALAGLAEPLGAMLAYLVLAPFISDYLLGAIYAVVAGIMLSISFGELLPASREYGHHNASLFGVLSGLVLIAAGLIIA